MLFRHLIVIFSSTSWAVAIHLSNYLVIVPASLIGISIWFQYHYPSPLSCQRLTFWFRNFSDSKLLPIFWGFRFRKIRYWKKSLGFSFGKIGIGKKSRYQFRSTFLYRYSVYPVWLCSLQFHNNCHIMGTCAQSFDYCHHLILIGI